MKTRHLLLLLLLIGGMVDSYCAVRPITVNNVSYPQTVNLFDLFEVSFSADQTLNPYEPDSITVLGVFIGPDNERDTVLGFYYEGYTFQYYRGYEHAQANPSDKCWRIRFTPDKIGTWSFYITGHVAEQGGSGNQNPQRETMYTFTCLSVSDADGFISVANSRYLKRDVVRNGVRQYHSYFPIGPNIAWYSNLDHDSMPIGIYHYKTYIDSLYNNANYMRIWINRYQYLSLYGPEYTQYDQSGNAVVYFDNTINQKDAAELDSIVTYAKQHGVSIMVSMFKSGDFKDQNGQNPNDPNKWDNNPFHTILGLENPCEFFTDSDAKRITKNLIRYIVARWGYATNIMSWEFWNEVDHMFYMCDGYRPIEYEVIEWHKEMDSYLRRIDPFDHCVSTSLGSRSEHPYLYSEVFNTFDFVQEHNYEHIQNAESRHQLLFRIYGRVSDGHTQHPTKPFFMGEFGFDQRSGMPTYAEKDPFGVDLHNTLWSSLFFTSMGPASFWWWPYVDSHGLYHHFKPLLTFCQNLPIPSSSFTTHHTGHIDQTNLLFPNNIETYYMINGSQDTIYGWSQDTTFAYQSLRRLTDSVHYVQTDWGPIHRFKNNAVYDPSGYVYTLSLAKRPSPSSNSNNITLPITSQPVGSRYLVRWYNSETGNLLYLGIMEYVFVQQDPQGNKFVSFSFPSMVRNLQQQTVNNRFGDAVFTLTLNNPSYKKDNTNENNKQ